MATGTTSHDREFLFRLQTLIIDGGTIVIKSIFDQKISNVTLNVFLATEKTTINRLRAQKTITRTQYDQLYPQSGQLPNSADFDITLLICLLRNLRSLGLNPNYLWHVPPQPADTSVEADLCRLKGFRNEVAHISSPSGPQQMVFQAKWKEIELVLLRLNTAVPNHVPNLKQTIDGYQNDSLDPVAEKRIQAEIKQWRKMEKGLEMEIQLINKSVTENVKEVLGLKDDIKEVKTQGAVLSQVDENVKLLTKDIKVVKKDVEVVTNIEENVNTLTEDVNKVKQHVEGMPKVQRHIQTLTEGVKGATENMAHDMKGDIKELNEHIKVLKKDVKEIKQDVTPVPRVQKKTGIFRRLRNVFSTRSSRPSRQKNLQDDMISFYRDQHRTISLSPLLEKETPLLEFYVMPDIYSIQNSLSGDKEGKTLVKPLRNVFYNNDNMCRKIYLIADAGLGKTALSKRLALTWCHAKKPHTNEGQYFSHEDIQALNEFGFVFLLLLRNCSSDCEIDDLIWNQIILRLGHKYTQEDLVNILCKERCLVILDGLDEWSHPSNSCKQGPSPIPHQKVRDRTAVLTTTRPWKLSVSGLQSSQIDQKLELVELNQTSAKALKKSVISHLCNEKNEDKLQWNVAKFTSDVEERQISDLKAIPLLLMYLLFLWCNKIELGQTQCDLYSQITELLLSRTVQNYIELLPKVDLKLSQGNIPQCLSRKTYCTKFYTLLTSLGQLAYETLFNAKREENTLVFDGSVAEQYLKESLEFYLKTGLITQSKVTVPGTLLEHNSKVSFAHKTVQEFFAALYMHSTSDQTSVPEIVLSKCKCIKDILEMSKILKFSCGMNVNVLSLISREMMKIINEDEITRIYRTESVFCSPLKDFQDMCISCCKEIPRENEVSLCLHDVFIEESCGQEQYRENLKQLTTRNKQNIRSLYINMDYMSHTPYSSVQKVIDYFALSDLENIEKIYCVRCEYDDLDSLPLLKNSVKCLYLRCREGGNWSRDLNTFKCIGLQSPVAIETMLETLRLSVNVKRVVLLSTNLGNRSRVFSSEMVNMIFVQLWRVTMTASVLQGIVDLLQQLPQSVTVEIDYCDIKPESEFVTVKQKIKTSREHFRILEDSEDRFGKVFKFETIKQGD